MRRRAAMAEAQSKAMSGRGRLMSGFENACAAARDVAIPIRNCRLVVRRRGIGPSGKVSVIQKSASGLIQRSERVAFSDGMGRQCSMIKSSSVNRPSNHASAFTDSGRSTTSPFLK
jgi:hypothetical protein